MIPRFTPIIAAWVRLFAPNLEMIFLTRPLTVSSVIESWLPISLLPFPAAISLQDLNFTRREGVIGGVLGKFKRSFGGKRLFPGMDGAEGLH